MAQHKQNRSTSQAQRQSRHVYGQHPEQTSAAAKLAKQKLAQRLQHTHIWPQQLARYVYQQLFPQRCYLCHQWLDGDNYLCESCLLTLPRLDGIRCLSCQNLLQDHYNLSQLHAKTRYCGRCQRQPSYITQALIPFLYQPPISDMISAFKYHKDLIAGATLSSLVWQYLTKHRSMRLPIIANLTLDHIIAVPMHPKKIKQRGFNQAHEIAKYMAKKSKMSLLAHACNKTKYHAPQSSLNYRDRLRGYNHGFTADASQLKEKNILLIDDVHTTGSTVQAAARALKYAGAKQIVVLAIAKTEVNR